MSVMETGRQLRVFYRDDVNGIINSSKPEELPAERLVTLAEHLLVAENNFLGVIDDKDTVLQCYLAADGVNVMIEMLFAEASGCLRLKLDRDAAMSLLAALPDRFDESLLKGAQYVD